jgi:signal transduction histidine kinase
MSIRGAVVSCVGAGCLGVAGYEVAGLGTLVLLFLLCASRFDRGVRRLEGVLDIPMAQLSSARANGWGVRMGLIESALRYLKTKSEVISVPSLYRREAGRRDTPDSHSEAQLWPRALSEIGALSGVAGAALITSAAGGRPIVHGALGESSRFRGVVERLYGGYFFHGEPPEVGGTDRVVRCSVFGDFAQLGYRYSLAYPFGFTRNGEVWRGLVWLGFAAPCPPREKHVVVVESLVRRLEEDLRLLEAVRGVSARARLAETSSARKSEFLTQVSHDIRSPLHNIQAVLGCLKEQLSDPRAHELIDTAARNCDGVGELVEDVLDFTRFKEGQLPVRADEVGVVAVVEELVRRFTVAAAAKGLELVRSYPNSELFVRVDRRHLRRIVSNLVGNAIKYTERGAVRIEIAPTHSHGLIRVHDTGIGMSEAEVAALFTPFSRCGDRSIEGIGLGLFVTRALVELNGGSVTVSSTPHVGSVFSVCLPISAPQADICPHPTAIIHTPTDNSSVRQLDTRPTVLIVDDDRDSCTSLARAFSRYPVETTIATSIPEAISLFNFSAPDVVITDLGMPLGGGERLLEYVHSCGRATQLYCLTGGSAPPAATRLRINGVFQKPVDVSELWRSILVTAAP